jgi:hypothetical protein
MSQYFCSILQGSGIPVLIDMHIRAAFGSLAVSRAHSRARSRASARARALSLRLL